MVVANRATRAGIPIPISSRKKKVTVSAENVALLKHEEMPRQVGIVGGHAGQSRQQVLSDGIPGCAKQSLPRRIRGARLPVLIVSAVEVVHLHCLRNRGRPAER